MMLLAAMPISSIATSPAIDLSRLPPPEIVPQTDFETRYNAKREQLLALFPPFSALVKSDPAIKLLQADSYDEQVLSQTFDDAVRQVLIAFARGANLDHLAALYAVARLEITPANPTGSAAIRGFFDTKLHSIIPADAITVTARRHAQLDTSKNRLFLA